MRRVVVITGGSRGIGEALVYACLEAGYDVAFTWRTDADRAQAVVAAAQARVPEGRVRAYALDVRDSAAVDQVSEQIGDELGEVWGVVCNAGISRNGLAFSLSDADWEAVLSTNLSGAFYTARAFLPALLSARAGRLLFISSITAPGATGQAAYAASKAGLLGLSGSLAREYGRRGVTVNTVVPGYFETDMTRGDGGVSSNNLRFAREHGLLGRAGELAELAHAVLFLLSPAASYVNGASVPVTGGLDWVP